MHLIPRVTTACPAFVHVDVDDLWAVGECYGYDVGQEWAHHISQTALPLFGELFASLGISATFFIVGRDLEHPPYAAHLQQLLAQGHEVANHSWSHTLGFRGLPDADLAAEIDRADAAIQHHLGRRPAGFRAPGYGWSPRLVQHLEQRGYQYDASLMPGPYGPAFRWMDRRLQNPAAPPRESGAVSTPTAPSKTQYPLLSDTFHSLYPHPVGTGRLIELPSATSGLLRLPFQAGVCMRLGYPYFRACLQPFRLIPALPFVFLFHAADLADFSGVPGQLFQTSSFFNTPQSKRLALARRFLQKIKETRPIVSTESWLS